MPLNVTCAHCQKRLKVSDNATGKKVRCPICGGTFVASAGEAPLVLNEAVSPRPGHRPPPLPGARTGQSGETEENTPLRTFAPIEFAVSVLRDTQGSQKGIFQGKLDPVGLHLRQKDAAFDFPVGTPARYLGNNGLSIEIEGRKLELAIFGQQSNVFWQRLYVRRLAGDAVRFLSGKKKTLLLRDYAVPRYLALLALLPLGLIFAGVGALVAGRGGSQGVLTCGFWGVVGGALTGLCVWFCQREKWATGLRAGACLGVSILGYGTLAMALLLSRAESDWQEFAPPGAGCSVLMPGIPVLQEQTVPGPDGPLRISLYMLQRRGKDQALLIAYNDYPLEVLQQDPEDIYNAAQQAAAMNVKGRVKNQKISLGSIPGRQAEITIPGKGLMVVRYYLAGNRLYQVGAVGSLNYPTPAEDVKRLFDSFKIQRSQEQTPGVLGKKLGSLAEARKGFQTKLIRKESAGVPVPQPPPDLFRVIRYDSPAGNLASLLSPDPKDGKKHPAIIWITGGDCNTIDDSIWNMRPANVDQTFQAANTFRNAGIVHDVPHAARRQR